MKGISIFAPHSTTMASIKNLVKFAAKFFEMGKTKTKAKAKPASKSKSKPAAKKTAKPVAKKATKPVAKKAAKPVKKAVAAKAKPVKKTVKKAKPVAKKTAKPVSKSVAKKAVKKVVKKAAKPVAKKAVKPAAKKAAKPVVKKAVKPVVKKEVKPAVKKAMEKKPVATKPIEKKEVKQVKPEVKQEVKAAVPASKVKSKASPASTQTKPVYNTQPAPIVQPKVNNAPKMRYSDEDLKEFKDLIDGKLATAREELKNLKEALENHTDSQAGNKAWNMEEGTDTSEMEYLMNQISRQHQYIRNLELALVRIENKTYGICRVSGNLIPKERLRVVPHATMSLEAKMNRKSVEESPSANAAAPPSDFSEGFEE